MTRGYNTGPFSDFPTRVKAVLFCRRVNHSSKPFAVEKEYTTSGPPWRYTAEVHLARISH